MDLLSTTDERARWLDPTTPVLPLLPTLVASAFVALIALWLGAALAVPMSPWAAAVNGPTSDPRAAITMPAAAPPPAEPAALPMPLPPPQP